MKKRLLVILGLILFGQGCAAVGDYVYTDKKARAAKEDEAPFSALPAGDGLEKDWKDYFLKENELTKECPVCLRRYQAYRQKCPYDGAGLQKVEK